MTIKELFEEINKKRLNEIIVSTLNRTNEVIEYLNKKKSNEVIKNDKY